MDKLVLPPLRQLRRSVTALAAEHWLRAPKRLKLERAAFGSTRLSGCVGVRRVRGLPVLTQIAALGMPEDMRTVSGTGPEMRLVTRFAAPNWPTSPDHTS